MKVLFIGNSHTFVHYVPARTAEFCKSYGQPIEPVMLTHPGMAWIGTCSSPRLTSTFCGAAMTP